MKGRPKDPTRAKRRTGNRPQLGEPAKLAVVPLPAVRDPMAAPAHLNETASAAWRAIVGVLDPMGMLQSADVFSLEAMARSWARAQEIGLLLDKWGPAVWRGGRGPDAEGNGEIVPNPLLHAERDSYEAFRRLAEQYGMTVASRLRLGLMQLVGQSLAESLRRDLEG